MTITGEQSSHTLALVGEALDATVEYCALRHVEELRHPLDMGRWHGLTRALNRVAERFGLHVARVAHMRAGDAVGYDAFSKWTSAGTLRSVLDDPQAFDDVYELLADESSRRTYDWYISCRAAYAIVGEAGLGIFPPRVAIRL